MVTDDGTFFGTTDDDDVRDWLDWGERFIYALLLAAQRISLAVAAGGFAIAGANMIDKTPRLGQVSLGAAAVFAVWFAVASISSVRGKR